MFDSNAFLQTTFDAAIDTARVPIPAGDYVAQVNTDEKAISVDKGTIGKGDRAGQEWAMLVVNLTIPDPSGTIKSATGRDPAIISHRVFLDLTPSGQLDLSTGKNIGFGKLFEAAGWDVDDKKRLKPGFSFGWLRGKTLKIRVEHEANPKDPSQTFERVTSVTKA